MDLPRGSSEGQRTREFRPDVDADDAAFLVIGTVQGLVLRWSLSKRGFDLVAEGERLLGVLLRGFQTPANRPAAIDPVGTDAPEAPSRSTSGGPS